MGQFAWLLVIATLGSFIWFYKDTVNRATLSNRIASLQSLATQEGKGLVLSVTLNDDNNVKYIVKSPQDGKKLEAGSQDVITKEPVSSWELENLSTAVSIGDNALPLGGPR